jgi:hypothetical protein
MVKESTEAKFELYGRVRNIVEFMFGVLHYKSILINWEG